MSRASAEKCRQGGAATTSTLSSCFNAGKVYGEIYVGGITGHASSYSWAYTSRIRNCYNVGDITATKDYAAGIAGYSAYNSITSCYCACEYNFSGGTEFSQVVTTLKSASHLYYRTERAANNFPKYVTELEESEMQSDDFVDTLNNGRSAWMKDTEGINSGYPILVDIDYDKCVVDEEIFEDDLDLKFDEVQFIVGYDVENSKLQYPDELYEDVNDSTKIYGAGSFEELVGNYVMIKCDTDTDVISHVVKLDAYYGWCKDKTETTFTVQNEVYSYSNYLMEYSFKEGYVLYCTYRGDVVFVKDLYEGTGDVKEYSIEFIEISNLNYWIWPQAANRIKEKLDAYQADIEDEKSS